MIRKKRNKRAIFSFVFPFTIVSFFLLMQAYIPAGDAHHTSRISYVFQKVGEKVVGCYSVELIATPPKLIDTEEKKLSSSEKHKILDRFTHRFQVFVRDESDAKAISGLRVRATFSSDEWKKTFDFQPATENSDPTYVANVALGPRGPYQVIITFEGTKLSSCKKIQPGEILKANIAFDNDYESLKEVMQAMLNTFDDLGREALTIGLDGEFVPPSKEQQIKKLAIRFKDLIPWTVNLREGAGQDVYEDRAAKLLEISEKMAVAADRSNFNGLVRRLASARAVCVNCHEIFQEADSTGTLPRLPVTEKPVDKSSSKP